MIVPDDTSDEILNYMNNLMEALDESIKLQAHYAELLNMWDGGHRIIFKDSAEWLARLKEMKENK